MPPNGPPIPPRPARPRAHYGGKPLVRGGPSTVAEGEGRARNVVLEFPSYEDAKAYAFSQEYAAARKLREGAGYIDIVAVEGV